MLRPVDGDVEERCGFPRIVWLGVIEYVKDNRLRIKTAQYLKKTRISMRRRVAMIRWQRRDGLKTDLGRRESRLCG